MLCMYLQGNSSLTKRELSPVLQLNPVSRLDGASDLTKSRGGDCPVESGGDLTDVGVLVLLLVPTEPLGVIEPYAERLNPEIVTDHSSELRAGDHHHEHSVDAACGGENVVGRFPGCRPRFRGEPDHVSNHFDPLLYREAVQGRTLAHSRLERPPEATGIDAFDTVLMLVGSSRCFVENDHSLERRVGV